MGGEDLVNVAVDERLKDAFDVRTYRSRISRLIVSRSFCRKQAQKAHNQSRARLKEWVTLHCSGVLLKHFCVLCAFLRPAFKNKYASGVCHDVNGIAARTGPAIRSTGAVSIIEHLSELLRRALTRHQPNEVTLGEELDLVRQYVAIEHARFSDRLRPEFRIAESLMSAAVPSFALQQLVENAIRHGIAKHTDAGLLLVSASRSGDVLEITVTDDGAGIDPTAPVSPGHGIDNTRERLRALYDERASLEIARRAEGGTIATLRLPYRELTAEPNGET